MTVWGVWAIFALVVLYPAVVAWLVWDLRHREIRRMPPPEFTELEIAINELLNAIAEVLIPPLEKCIRVVAAIAGTLGAKS